MNNRRHRVLGATALVVIVLGLNPVASTAQDAAVANPKTVHVKLENENVRVLEAELPPGTKENVHAHPASVIYVLSGGRIRNHSADGTATERDLKSGDTIYRDPMRHWSENIGTTTVHLILVELKACKDQQQQ